MARSPHNSSKSSKKKQHQEPVAVVRAAVASLGTKMMIERGWVGGWGRALCTCACLSVKCVCVCGGGCQPDDRILTIPQ